MYNRFILHGECRRLEICRGGGGRSARWRKQVSDDQGSHDQIHDDEVGYDIPEAHRHSVADLRQMRESRSLYWELNKDRRVMFMNHTDKVVYVFVFSGQEQRRELGATTARAPIPVGSVELGATNRSRREARSGASKPTAITIPGVSAPSAAPIDAAAVLPPFEVFDISRNAGRRLHYMVATLEGNEVLVWKRDDARGGKQVHIQPSTASPEVSPIFRKEYKIADGDAALSVVMRHFL